ncbi:(2Fe-2S)-binding protein [Azovibrio restrictus]|uniref:(2Fe-2S)-binding protein n=1 Tax=Azovibrio restrictus TaxID=146938 RepID=UPI0026E95481|nr:(2Fe-2S)-binding protein [Azovibrio restrictus]MDD3485020.1 (2Fe-2S)-binding protein [Azovibrio restrictus]
MYVCVCQGVTERQIQEAARNGASRLKDLRQQLGVTQDCGRCATCAHECLKDARKAQQQSAAPFMPVHLAPTPELMPA